MRGPGAKAWATPWSFFRRFVILGKKETAACGVATVSITDLREAWGLGSRESNFPRPLSSRYKIRPEQFRNSEPRRNLNIELPNVVGTMRLGSDGDGPRPLVAKSAAH
jgi:hypothetical protein